MQLRNRMPSTDEIGFGNSSLSILAPIFTLSSISALGIGSFSLEGISLTQTVFGPWNGISISLAAVLSIGAVLWAYSMNNNDFSTFNDSQSYVAYATAGSVAILALAPTLRNAIASSQAASWTVLLVQLVGFGLIAGIHGGGQS